MSNILVQTRPNWLARGGLLVAGAATGAAVAVAGVQAQRRIAAVETLTAEEAAPEGKFAVVDGYRVRYVEAGSPDAPAVLLLHGFLSSAESWRATFDSLADRYHLIAPDLFGFGYSQRTDEPVYTLRHQAEFVAALLDHLGVERAIVIGNSMGGAVALQLAISYPNRVERLVLVDAAAGYTRMGRSPSPLLGKVLQHTPLGKIMLAGTLYDDARLPQMLHIVYAHPDRMIPEVLPNYARPRRVRGNADSLLALLASSPDDNLPKDLGQIQVPALLIWGREDHVIPPPYAERLQGALPDNRLEWIEDCGHAPQEERPAEFNRLVREFLQTTG